MPIRDDIVASAVTFLQDPSVASSPVENRIAFLQAKNLTQDEVNAALARASGDRSAASSYGATPAGPPQGPPQSQMSPFYGQYPPYAWQQPPPEMPRRDWRDWFIMATVVGGVGYGLMALTKRYIYPLVAPPTPERLEQDKKSIDEQFEKAFALVDQLAQDTATLKAAETQRTERLDAALSELETVINDLKSSNRRREDEMHRHQDDIEGLKASLPKALDTHREMTDSRLREVNTELKSLKTLISQRMNPGTSSSGTGNYLRPSSGNASPAAAPSLVPAASVADENAPSTNSTSKAAEESRPTGARSPNPSSYGAGSPLSSGMSARASIPAWQKSMVAPGASSNAVNGSGEGSSSTQDEAGGS